MGLLGTNKSGHLPEVAGNIESFTGTLIVDTGLRKLRTHGANLNQTPAAAAALTNAVALPATNPGDTVKLRLEAWEDDTTTPAAVATSVSWWALGE
jgi:hypothetical protein